MRGSDSAGNRRLVSLASALPLIPAAILLTAGSSGAPPAPEPAGWQPQIVAADRGGLPTASAWVITPTLAESDAALRRLVAERPTARALDPGVGSERGLQVKTILVKRAVSALFPEIQHIGGVRPDALRWHPEGLAIDVMIPDYATPAGKDLGDRIAAFALANAERFGVDHVIWQQVYYPATGSPQVMPNLGSDNQNHYSHVHIATLGGGYPSGSETYFG
jgi:hypothetical protein